MARVLQTIQEDDLLHSSDGQLEANPDQDRRRAAVFYADHVAGVMAFVNWWIFTWRFLGLDSAEEGFDLVFMTHPANVANLPSDCHLVTDSFSLNYTAPGQCLYRPYLGIAHRDMALYSFFYSIKRVKGEGTCCILPTGLGANFAFVTDLLPISQPYEREVF